METICTCVEHSCPWETIAYVFIGVSVFFFGCVFIKMLTEIL